MQVLTVWTLEVWGHGPDEHGDYGCDGECDGYTVNDRSRCGELTLADGECTDARLASALYDNGFTTTPDAGEFEILWHENMIEVNDGKSGEPLFQLEA